MKDEFAPIKMDTWPMAESFYYYSQMSPASYSLTVEIDVTKSRKHLKSKYIIESFINNISNLDFDGYIQKNKNHCKFCEFNKLCNNQNINYDMISEMEEEDD